MNAAKSKRAQTGATEVEIVVTRVFNAPRELVWRAFTDPQQLMRWWGPKGYTSPACQIDLREGGKYLYCMRSPEGQNIYSTGVYQKIDPPNEIIFTDSFADEHGNVVPGSHYGLGADFPHELRVILTFDDLGGKTRLTLRHAGMPAGEMSEGASVGWSESFDKLAEVLRNP